MGSELASPDAGETAVGSTDQDSDLMRLNLEKWAEAVVMLSKNIHK